jgi:hypothetical protein
MPSTLSAGADAAGSFLAAKRQRDLQDQAKKYQQQRDARKDMESDRTFGLEQGEAADAHARTVSDIAHTTLEDRIAKAQEDFRKQMEPLERTHQLLENKIAAGQVLDAKDLHLQRQYELITARVTAQVAQKYAIPQAALSLQQGKAELAHTNAETASTNASTAYTEKATSLLGTGGFGGGGGRGSASDRKEQVFNDAMDSLSDKGREFYDMLYSTNNPPTRAQALLALDAVARRPGKGGITPGDVRALKTMIEDKSNSQFVTPTNQAAAARATDRAEATDAKTAEAQNNQKFETIKDTPAFKALPAESRAFFQQGVDAYGFDSAVQHLRQFAAKPGGPIPQEQAAGILSALGG